MTLPSRAKTGVSLRVKFMEYSTPPGHEKETERHTLVEKTGLEIIPVTMRKIDTTHRTKGSGKYSLTASSVSASQEY